MMSFETTPSCD